MNRKQSYKPGSVEDQCDTIELRIRALERKLFWARVFYLSLTALAFLGLLGWITFLIYFKS